MTAPAQRTGSAPAPTPLTVLVIAKEPVPGRVKTRLTPPFTPAEAAELAQAALADTLRTVADLPAVRRVLVLAGATGPWLPAGFDVRPQSPGGLDERIAAAFAACHGPALLLGMDTPHLSARTLAPVLAADAFTACDAWLGPAADGGFWSLALADAQAAPVLVRGVPMSRPDTGALQRRRLTDAGLRVRALPVLRDVDTVADAAEVARQAPGSRFARAYQAARHRTGAR
ncbi:DUF2064 domain-containing protein [Streptomyces sp. JJ66]|uniref:TIGR04282 family arsenosugar biosynthesis glycosyltransferase n=1 Tax=Streptomyces sp. JJ66 TaxID=2803843 RepID=UPI001C55E0B5|nr:DUF2064 domain-containing protein [Streptomyces sp. JJ66]MBW1602048.1 DUF2064 domain-containing protein [Streptomyces sp. JJ66]